MASFAFYRANEMTYQKVTCKLQRVILMYGKVMTMGMTMMTQWQPRPLSAQGSLGM